ncbi:MAG: hypothetical protein GWN55_00335, partial [Phycisphaerae bacterium]|nr:hypothetical protein [Phycisphaerae bacterium]NIV68673.1 hypothetical protein [Phycisphaerae bacterium]
LGRDRPANGHPSNGRPLADSVLSGEYEEPLVKLAAAVVAGEPPNNLPGVSTAEVE